MPKEKFKEWPLTDAYGICRQTILQVYRLPTFDSALVTQLLFGECYQVHALTPDRNWYKIFHKDTGRIGWIPSQTLKEIPKEDYFKFLSNDYQVVTSPIAAIEYRGFNLYLLPGSRLHFSEMELFNWQDHIGFTGSVRSHSLKADRVQLLDIASKYINAPYQAGGRSIFGLDEYQAFELIFAIAGYYWKSDTLPGEKLDIDLAMPGDLIIFEELESKKTYFSLYLGTEEVLWMDNRMKISDISEWQSVLQGGKHKQVEIYAQSIVT